MIYDLLRETALTFPNREAIIHNCTRMTFQQLLQQIDAVVSMLYERNTNVGCRIALLCKNPMQRIISYFAIQKCGCVAVLLSMEMPHQEMMECLELTNSNLVLCDFDKEDINIPYINVSQGVLQQIIYNEIRYFDESTIFFTSGTTGRPKGIVASSKKILKDIKINRNREPIFMLLGYQFDHSAGIGMVLQFLLNGSCVILTSKLNAFAIMKELTSESATALATTPTLLRNLFLFCETQNTNFEKIKYLFLTSERVTDDLVQKAKLVFPNVRIRQNYALTETGIITTQRDEDMLNNPYSVGKIKSEDTKVKIIDGEIWIKNDKQLLYYIGEEERRQGGWFPTGDFGYIEDGQLILMGRKDEMINVGGEKVFAKEVEQVLLKVKWIDNVKVYGFKNSITGNIVAADIQTSKEYSKDNLKEIRNICSQYLQKYKRPLIINFFEELPMNSNGKILRK